MTQTSHSQYLLHFTGRRPWVQYVQRADVDHLFNSLSEIYVVKAVTEYLGFIIEFDDDNHCVYFSMPECVPKLLQRHAAHIPDGDIDTPPEPTTGMDYRKNVQLQVWNILPTHLSR